MGVETVLTGKVVGRGEGGTWVVSVSGKDIEVTKPLNEGETVVLHISPESVLLSHNFVGKMTSIQKLLYCQDNQYHTFGAIHQSAPRLWISPRSVYYERIKRDPCTIGRKRGDSLIQGNRCAGYREKRNGG